MMGHPSRMVARHDGTSVPRHIPRRLAWDGHMAPCGSINIEINQPALRALTLPHRHSLLLVLLSRLIMDFVSGSPDYSCSACRSLYFMCSAYPTACTEPSAHTQMGRRCSLLSCMETTPGCHFSHSAFCHSNSNFQVPLGFHCGFAPVQTCYPCLGPIQVATPAMPRLRH